MHARRGLRLGLGPVFAYEWIISSRRWQAYALRSLFVLMLLAALVVIWSSSVSPRGPVSFRQLAELGETFYLGVIGTQLTLVLLAAPAATAGAICLDRASGAMTHLLVTDLSDSEIVLGKLAARLVPVLGLVACAAPLMAIMTLLGGVDPTALFASLVITVGVAVLGCAIALAFSLRARRTHEALLGTYAVWGIWLVGRPFAHLVNTTYGWSLAVPPLIADPFYLAFSPYWYPSSFSIESVVGFLGVTLAISTALVVFSIWRLRAVCTRVSVPQAQSLRGRLAWLGERLELTRYLPGPSLDGNPVLWREWHRARPSRWSSWVGVLFVVTAILSSLAAIAASPSTFAMAWVNGLQVSIGMLLLSVTAATTLAEERVRGSLDVLMATTLTTREIVLGKWLGSFRLAPLLAILPTIVVLCGDHSKWFYLPTVLLTLAFVLACGAAITGLGLLMATVCSRLGRAVALTVSLYVLVAVGWLFLGSLVLRGPSDEGFMMASPFFYAGELAADLCAPNQTRAHIGWAIFWLFAYSFAAFWLLVATLLSFNRCLGRIEYGIARSYFPPTGWRKPPPIEGIEVGIYYETV
jgi:ABC-type transport system involved in multi-copper enzyme maturation permease subunit